MTNEVNPVMLGFRGALAHQTSKQTVSDGTNERVNLDSYEYDTDGIVDSISNRLKVPPGVERIRIAFGFKWASAYSGRAGFLFYKNGSVESLGMPQMTSNMQNPFSGQVTGTGTIIKVVGGDQIYYTVYQNSGGPADSEGNKNCWLAMEIVG